jgi:hypothetical protein
VGPGKVGRPAEDSSAGRFFFLEKPPVSLYGARELAVRRFDGGLVLDVDATEIDDDQCSLAENVDFRDYGLGVRRGYATASTVAVSSKINGLHRYYHTDGTTKWLAQAGTVIYEGSAGTLASTVTGLTGTVPFDFIGYREVVYGGSSKDALRKRSDAGVWSSVTPLTPPTGIKPEPFAPTVHAFEDATENANPTTGWAWTNTGDTDTNADPDNKREGIASVVFTFDTGSRGDSATRQLSLGAVADLSYAEKLVAYVQANKAGAIFQLGIAPNSPDTQLNGGINNSVTAITVDSTTGYEAGDYIRIDSEIMLVTGVTSSTVLAVTRAQEKTAAASHLDNAVVRQAVNFSLFSDQETVTGGTWTTIEIGLDRIPPARRTAVAFVGIRLTSPGRNFNTPPEITLDQLVAVGPLEADSYLYSASYALTTRINNVDVIQQESNPVTAALFKLEADPPVYGVKLSATGTPDSGVNVVRYWRYRDTGPFRTGRLIGTMPVSATAIDDATNISATDTDVVVDSVAGYSAGCVVLCGTEEMLVHGVNGTTRTLTVSRGWNGTVPTTHADNAVVTPSYFTDLRSDGALALEDAEELADGRVTPPLAATYAIANGRLYAGNVTISGTNYPWRVYVSRAFFPDEFRQVQTPDGDPASAGWFDLPSKDYVRRLVEADGTLLIFTDRSIWALEGTGWDDFAVYQRANVGLDAREAVAVSDKLVYFLSSDGVRVLQPGGGNFEGNFPCWVISEPVESKLRAIPYASRLNAAMGIDERGRLHLSLTRAGQSANDASLTFDPQAGGMGNQGYVPNRRGWTYYTSFGWSCYTRLKRGGGDAGQLVAGAASATATLYYLQRSSLDVDLVTDSGSAIAWLWQGKAYDAGPGSVWEWSFVSAEWDAAANQAATATPVLDGTASATTYTLTLSSASSGFVTTESRVAPGIRGRYAQLKLSGSQSVALRARGVRVGLYQRG